MCRVGTAFGRRARATVPLPVCYPAYLPAIGTFIVEHHSVGMIRLRPQSKVLIVRPDALAGNIINGQDTCMCSQLCMPVKMDLRRDGCMQKRVVQPVWVLSSAIFSIQLILLWRSRHCLSTMLRSTLPSNHARPLLRIIRTRLPRFEGLLVGTSTVSATVVVVKMSGDGAASRLLKLLLDLLRAFSIATLDCSGMAGSARRSARSEYH